MQSSTTVTYTDLRLLLKELESGQSKVKSGGQSVRFLQAMVRYGINVCWVMTGEGSMFAHTRAGENLKNQFGEKLTAYLAAEEPLTK